ncbi:MAG: DUF1360 domain-containing protein [Leptothrix sp. (in: b-proteobacteria)]
MLAGFDVDISASPWWPFMLGSLATWRICHLVAHEDGPGDLIVKLRIYAGTSFWGGLMDCFYCLSLWVAAPLAVLLAQDMAQGLWFWLALSGAACLLERVTTRSELPPHAQ